jgi:hypothetical protein
MSVLIILLSLAAEPVPVETLTAREGDVEVVGRYGEFLDRHLALRGSKIEFILESQDLTQKLFGLRAGIDRLIVKGRFTGADTIAVAALEPTDTEAAVYRRRGEAAQGTSATLLALGDEALARARAYDDTELKDVAAAILRKGFLARKSEVDPGDAAAQLAWVKDMVARTNDVAWAIEELGGRLAREPSWEPGKEFLRSLGCIAWRDTWYTRDDFLKAQGQRSAGGAWLLPEELALKDALARLARLKRGQDLLRTRTDPAYKSDAERGVLAVGMTRQEAVKAWGFPDDVRRVPQDGYSIDQWRYGESLVYLLDDTVALIPSEKRQ